MVESSCKPDAASWVIPYLWVADVDTAMAEYSAAFGFQPGQRNKDSNGRTAHGEMLYQGRIVIMLGAEGLAGTGLRPPSVTGKPAPVGLYVYCEDIDSLALAALSQGMTLTEPVKDTFWGERIANLRDNSGYAWTFAMRTEGAVR